MLYKPSGRHRTTLRMLDPQPGDAILDVGCNAGYFEHHFLRGRVARAVGGDVDEAAVRIAQSSVPGVELYC
jgi:ribosomal protein L11 methylase PrmA